MPIESDEAIVIDTETTGLSPRKDSHDGYGPDRICSLAAIMIRRHNGVWSPVSQKISRFNPGRPVIPEAMRVNGFFWNADTNMACPDNLFDLRPLKPFAASAGAVVEYIGNRPVVAHNARFDMDFLDTELERAGLKPLAGTYVCTREALAEMTGQGRTNKYASGTRLDDMCAILKIRRETRRAGHGALVDAQLCAEGFASLDTSGYTLEQSMELFEHRAGSVSLMDM